MIYRAEGSLLSFHLVLLAIVALATVGLTMRTTDKERNEYQALVIEALSEKKPEAYEAHQRRDGIYREIVLIHKESRLQTRLLADRGVLSLKQDEGEVQFSENLYKISCVMQEELIVEKGEPKQIVRHILTDHATYDFATQTLKTERMVFERYKIPGHQLPEDIAHYEPTLQGHADSATIVFKESGPVFHAKHLKVKIPGVA